MAVLFFIVLIDLVGFGVIIPLLPFYAEHFGAAPYEVTLMMACYSLAQLFFSPIWGRLSDRFGRRPILLVSLGFGVASYLWLGFADALWMLFGARLLAGAGAGNIAAAQAYITDVTPPEKRAKGMGMLGAAFGLGFTIGPALGGLVAGAHPGGADLARPAFLAAGLSAAAFLGTLLRLKESLPPEARDGPPRPGRLALAREAFGRPALRRLILLFLVTTTAFAGLETTFALWAQDAFGWGPMEVGAIFFYVGIVLVAVQGGLIGRLTRRFGEARLLVAGSCLIACGLALLPFARLVPLLVVVNGVLALGMALASPTTNSLISREAAIDERGGIMGVAQSAASLGRIVGPAIAGFVFTAYGPNAPYYLGAAMMIPVIAMALKLPRERMAPRALGEAAPGS